MVRLVAALVLLLASTVSLADSGRASYYSNYHQGRMMANGKPFDMRKMTVAHKTLKLGTKLEVCYKKRCALVVVTDRGPYVKGRVLDLSYAVAKKLNMIKLGTAIISYRKVL